MIQNAKLAGACTLIASRKRASAFRFLASNS